MGQALNGQLLTGQTLNDPRLDSRIVSSRQINEAIETLIRAGVPDMTRMALDTWNATRINKLARRVDSAGDLQRLIAGLDRKRLAEDGVL
jgi:hypothetical protein